VLTTTYTYDDASRLDIVTDPNLGTYDHDYDPNGNRAALSYPNGTNTTYLYDDLNRLTNLTTTGPSGTIQSYQYTLGPAGNRTQIDEADGTTRAYDYDNLYRLTLETVQWLRGSLKKDGVAVRLRFPFQNRQGVTFDFPDWRIDSMTALAQYPGFPSTSLKVQNDKLTLIDRPGWSEGIAPGSVYEANVDFLVTVYEARLVGFVPQISAFRDPEHPRPLDTHEWSFRGRHPPP